MKTPMQELIERLNNVKPQEFCTIEKIKGWADELLKKEKEIICNAFSDARHGAVESRWTAEEYFEETFKIK